MLTIFCPQQDHWLRIGYQRMHRLMHLLLRGRSLTLSKYCLSRSGRTVQTTSLSPSWECQVSRFEEATPMRRGQQVQKNASSAIFPRCCTKRLLSFRHCEATPANLRESVIRRVTRERIRDSDLPTLGLQVSCQWNCPHHWDNVALMSNLLSA
jgi:hypothetical protein